MKTVGIGAVVAFAVAALALAASPARGRLSSPPTAVTGTAPIVVTGSAISCNPAGAGTAGDGCLTHSGPIFVLDGGLTLLGPVALAVGSSGISTDGGMYVFGTTSVTGTTNSAVLVVKQLAGTSGGGVALIDQGVGAYVCFNGEACTRYFQYNGASMLWSGVPFNFATSIHTTSTLTAGTITLVLGTGTATVTAASICTATDTAATPVILRASLSGTTLTVSESTGTSVHAVNYICL